MLRAWKSWKRAVELVEYKPEHLAPSANYAPTKSAYGVGRRMRYWHEYVIDLMLTNPELDQNTIAAMLGRSPSWLSRIVNSHMFQEAKALRRMEHDAGIHASIVDKLESLADLTLDLMTERVVQKGNEMPMQMLRETCDSALKALGYTASPNGKGGAAGPQVAVHVHQATPEGLEEARRKLRAVNAVVVEVDSGDIMLSPEELPPGEYGVVSQAGEGGAPVDARAESPSQSPGWAAL